MQKVVILGGGEAGYYVAKKLEKSSQKLDLTLIDMRPQMVYQPFLAEVVSGSIEARHVLVPLGRHLPKTNVVLAKVTGIDHAKKTVSVEDKSGVAWQVPYDQLVVTLGAVTKTFPTPGIADHAVGLKTIEEAVFIRNKITSNFLRAGSLPKGSPEREQLLSFFVVGGGFSGVECFAEMTSYLKSLCKKTKQISMDEVELHLIEAADRIMPELPAKEAQSVIANLEKDGAHVHLNTFVEDASDCVVRASDGTNRIAGLIVWTAGSLANPVMKNSDLPIDERGRLRCNAKLQVIDEEGNVLEGIWGAGDCTNVPDLSGGGMPDGTCAPTAQHAFRQAKVLAGNVLRSVEGGSDFKEYNHSNAGMVAGLGVGRGSFVTGSKKHSFGGPLAWLAHRGYHGFALPSWERKFRVWADWTAMLFCGRDMTYSRASESPRDFFEEFAARPKED